MPSGSPLPIRTTAFQQSGDGGVLQIVESARKFRFV